MVGKERGRGEKGRDASKSREGGRKGGRSDSFGLGMMSRRRVVGGRGYGMMENGVEWKKLRVE